MQIAKVKNDLTGQSFGMLTVIKRVEDKFYPNDHNGHGRYRDQWLCKCSCDNNTEKIFEGNRLTRINGVRNCGCVARQNSVIANKKYNKYDLSGEYGIGWTTNTDIEFYFDLEDYDKIKEYAWRSHKRTDTYNELQTTDPLTGKVITIPQIILGKWHDHIDRNPMNNRKENLRPCDRYQNAHNASKRIDNKSGVTGVYWDKHSQRWKATIMFHRKNINLGSFYNKTDAIIARLNAEVKYFKEFAPQKHLFKKYNIQEYKVGVMQLKHKLFLIAGETSCGKTTLANKLCEELNLNQIISYTTRPKRKGEGDTHVFVDDATYEKMKADNNIAAYTNISGYHYWSTVDQLYQNNIYIIDPIGIASIEDLNITDIDFCTIYINVPIEVRIDRAMIRGDKPEVLTKRIGSEMEQFLKFKAHAGFDYSISNLNADKAFEVLKKIIEIETIQN